MRPLHAKAFFVIHRVAADKDLLWNEMNREIKKVKYDCFAECLLIISGFFTYSFADFCVKKETVATAGHHDTQNAMVNGKRKE